MDAFKKIIGFVVGFAIVAGIIHGIRGGDKLEAFEEFRCDEGGFTVLLPGQPKRTPKTANTAAGTITLVMYIAGTDESAFVASYADYPKRVIDESNFKEMLDGATEGAVRNAGGTLLEQTDCNFHGKPGREIRIRATKDGKTGTLRAWHILVGNRLYQLMVASPSDDIVDEKGSEFFDSLRIDGLR